MLSIFIEYKLDINIYNISIFIEYTLILYLLYFDTVLYLLKVNKDLAILLP